MLAADMLGHVLVLASANLSPVDVPYCACSLCVTYKSLNDIARGMCARGLTMNVSQCLCVVCLANALRTGWGIFWVRGDWDATGGVGQVEEG